MNDTKSRPQEPIEKGSRTPQQDRGAEYGEGNLNRQAQTEGTPRPFSNEAGKNESRNISPQQPPKK